MAEKSLSEVKFALQDALIEKGGLSAASHVDAIDRTMDKEALGAAVAKAVSALEAGKKPDAAKALSALWSKLRGKL